MKTLAQVKSLASKVLGHYIDIDVAYGGQCWDWAAYYSREMGWTREAMTTTAGPGDQHNGYASAIWRHFYSSPSRVANYNQIPASVEPETGWIAIWDKGGKWPDSHVAVYSHTSGGQRYYWSQNPNPVQLMPLTSVGLLGWLAPKDLENTKQSAPMQQTPIWKKDEDDMFLIHVDGTQGPFQLIHLGTLRPVQTFPAGDKSVNKFAARFGNSIPLSRGEYDYYVTGKAAAKVA